MLVSVEVLAESVRLSPSGPYYFAGDKTAIESESDALAEALERGWVRRVLRPADTQTAALQPPADKMMRSSRMRRKTVAR